MLAPEEQLKRLRRAEADLRGEAAALARRGARRQRDIERRLQGLEEQKKALKASMKSGWFS